MPSSPLSSLCPSCLLCPPCRATLSLSQPIRRGAAPPHAGGSGNLTVLPPHNRLRAVLVHCPRYMFEGQARLAADVGVARSTISRLVAGKTNPSIRVVQAVQAALEQEVGRSLPLPELFSPDGSYPTRSACRLCGCDGCMPEEAYDKDGNRREEYQHMEPGDWSVSPAAPSSRPPHRRCFPKIIC